MTDTPLFEVTTAAANAAARRLVTAAEARAIIGTSADDDATLEIFIDAICTIGARRCGLAADTAGTLPTFGSEVVKATWAELSDCPPRGPRLVLPWRVPISAVGAVTEGGEALAAGTDYQLLGGAILERRSGGAPVCWSSGAIIVPYTAGWSLPDGAPPDLKMAVIEQVKAMWFGRARDPVLRATATENVGSATFSVAGGDSIEGNLLVQVAAAFDQFRAWSV